MQLPNLQELRYLNDKENSGSIFFLPFCQDRIKKHPSQSTKEWLVTKKILKDQAAIQAILRSDNFDPRYVAVKIGDREKTSSEYYRSRLLYTNGVKGFVPYICMFHCSDDYVVEKREDVLNVGFCGKDTPGSMYALVMPYLASGSLEELIADNAITFDSVKRIICATVDNQRNAINVVGLIHGDCSFNNVFPAVDDNNQEDSFLIDFGHSFVIPRNIMETRTAEELIGYSVMVYKDYLMLLYELGAVYLKKNFQVIGLPELHSWVQAHLKGKRMDIDQLKRKITALTLESAILPLASKSTFSLGMGPRV